MASSGRRVGLGRRTPVSAEAGGDGRGEGAVVAVELPDHGAAEVVVADVGGLAGDGALVVVGPERGAVVQPGGGGVPVEEAGAGEGLEHLVILAAGLPGAGGGGAGLVEAVVDVGDAGPAVAVVGDAEQQLAGRRVRPQVGLDGQVAAEL